MAEIRINQLPNATGSGAPSASDVVPIDGATTRKATIKQIVETGRPVATQAQAEAGTDPDAAMTPLTTAQAIAAQALTPSDIGTTAGTVAAGNDPRLINAAQAFVSVSAASGTTIPASVTSIRTQFYAPNFAVPATLKGGGRYKRISGVNVFNYPSRGRFRSQDRFMPDGTVDNSNGGWWVLDEDLPNAHQFGGIGDGVTDDADALQALLDFWSIPAQQAIGSVTSRPLAMSGGGRVHIPKGVWRHTRTLYQNAYIQIEGDGHAMFPQAPLTGVWYGQDRFPNATILRPDFAPEDRTYGVGIQTSPYVLRMDGAPPGMAGQTVGTRFKSLTDQHPGNIVDAGYTNYCEKADIRNLTIWPVNEIFAGIRWTAASGSCIDSVSVSHNVKRGILTESAWESYLNNVRIVDFKEYGLYLGGNSHSVKVYNGWVHAAGRVLAGDRPTGIFVNYFNGVTIDSIAVDECWDAIVFQTGTSAFVTGVHSERTKNVWLTTNDSYGIYGVGNHMIQNVTDPRTYENTIIWDGNGCQVDISVIANLTGLGTEGFPGYTIAPDVNPNTGEFSNVHFAITSRTSVTFRGMKPTSKDRWRVNRLSGNIQFLSDDEDFLNAGSGLGNQYSKITNLIGDANVKKIDSLWIRGNQTRYIEEDGAGFRYYRASNNGLLFGARFSDNALLFGAGLAIVPVSGNPNTFVDGNIGTLAVDTSAGKLYIKTSASGTLTGWVVVGTQT